MDDFAKLEDIGLKEVSDKTHIEIKYLQYMINNEFDKLNKSSTIGFAKILSREYKLDLEDWLNEAHRYWSENKIDDGKPKIFIVQKSQKTSKAILIIISIAILAIILYGAYLFLNKKLDFFENPVVKTDTNFTYEDTPVVNEAKESLDKNISQNDKNETTIIETNQTNIPDEIVTNSENEVNNTIISPKKNVQPSEINSTTKASAKINMPDDKNTTKTSIINKSENYISPNTKLWLGVIYLDNYKRRSFLGTRNFILNSSRDQLITTGHGNFNLQFNGVLKKFHSQNPIRLLIKNGKISVISDKEFKNLNKGSIW